MPRWLNAANLLTLLRLVLAPFVVKAILDGQHTLALALFCAAAFTDLLDGAAARRFSGPTVAGAYLDPVADKCLLSGVFLALAWAEIVPWWLVAVIFGRDLCILLGVLALMVFTSVRKFPPSVWGKASTFVQIVTAVVWMVRNMRPSAPLDQLAAALLWLAAAVTLWSGIDYALRAVRGLRSH